MHPTTKLHRVNSRSTWVQVLRRHALCAGIALIIGILCAQNTYAGDWPQFLGPTRNGVYAEKDIATVFPAAGPKVLWKTEIGHGLAGPVVAGGKVILLHRVEQEECVECVDAESGKSVWKSAYPTDYSDDFGFDDGPRSMPTVADGKIYTYGAAGMLGCWDFATGRKIWTVDTRKTFHSPKGFFGRACAPLVEGDAVILNIGAKGAGVVAFDKSSGKVLWQATDDAASYSSPTAATIGGKRYVFALTRAALVCLDPKTGSVYFRHPFRPAIEESVTAATPLVIGDKIFISASYNAGAVLLQFDEKNPKVIWSGDNILSNHYATSVTCNGYLFGYDGRQEQGPTLTCVELLTGKPMWREEGFGAGTITLAGNQLLLLTEKGQLILAPASAEGFKPTARAQVLPFNVRAYPALADGRLYARSTNELVCVDLRGK